MRLTTALHSGTTRVTEVVEVLKKSTQRVEGRIGHPNKTPDAEAWQ